jgi:hypothetical protein
MKKRCPNCGVYLNDSGGCWSCAWVRADVPPEVRRRRKVVDMLNKDVVVSEKVANFLEIK